MAESRPQIPAGSGITAIPLPTPFAVGRVNCYLIEDDPLVLIDPGPHSVEALDELDAALDEARAATDEGARRDAYERAEERTAEIYPVVLVAVTDEGQGIAPADQDRIFERFYRVDPARSRATGGTGLGLSIVKHICANHGGDVSVWSEPAHGSTFTVRLPAADPAGPARPLPGLASVQALPSERQQLTRGEP